MNAMHPTRPDNLSSKKVPILSCTSNQSFPDQMRDCPIIHTDHGTKHPVANSTYVYLRWIVTFLNLLPLQFIYTASNRLDHPMDYRTNGDRRVEDLPSLLVSFTRIHTYMASIPTYLGRYSSRSPVYLTASCPAMAFFNTYCRYHG